MTGLFGAVTLLATPLPSMADADSAQLFTNTCAGCHANGGNIVRREATLQSEDLAKYGFSSPDELFKVIYNGRGSMPGYGEGCAPRGACTFGPRLTDGQIRALADYVLEEAARGWKGN